VKEAGPSTSNVARSWEPHRRHAGWGRRSATRASGGDGRPAAVT
jgi:hypothetical protein